LSGGARGEIFCAPPPEIDVWGAYKVERRVRPMGYIRKDGLQGVHLALWPKLVKALDEYADYVGSTRTDVVRRLVVGLLRDVKRWPPTSRRVEKVALADLAPSNRRKTRRVGGRADPGEPIVKGDRDGAPIGGSRDGAPIGGSRDGAPIVKRRRAD